MQGRDVRDGADRGIIPRAIEALFAGVAETNKNIDFSIKASYIDIYCEKVKAIE